MNQHRNSSKVSPLHSGKKLQRGVIYHPVHGYPIPPPVPVAVARRNARERNRVKTVNDSYLHLKNHVPGAARQKRMSKVDIIKHSIDYIQKLQKMVKDSEKNSFQFPTFQQMNMQSENAQVSFFNQFQPQYQYSNSNQNNTPELSPEVPVSPSSSTSDSTGSSSDCSTNLLSSYLCAMSSSPYQGDSYNTNNELVDDQVLEDNILDVIAEWQDS